MGKRAKVFFVLFIMLFFSCTGYYCLTAKDTERKFINCGGDGNSCADCLGLAAWCYDYRMKVCTSSYCKGEAMRIYQTDLEMCDIMWDPCSPGGGGGTGDHRGCMWDYMAPCGIFY